MLLRFFSPPDMPFLHNQLVKLYSNLFIRNIKSITFADLLKTSTNSALEPEERGKIDVHHDIMALPFSSGKTRIRMNP